jgi:fumarate hydratase, class II
MPSKRTRVERDSMGAMRVPADAYFGASTQRAVLNFPVSDLRLQAPFITALALIKHAAAVVNVKHGKLEKRLGQAIGRAALEVARGNFAEHFVVDVFQTGSGTSTNMNMNEVIANRAIELLGGKRGNRTMVHPNDHVNAGMSSNDAIPTATHVAALMCIDGDLLPALRELHASLAAKVVQFRSVIKTGRTHLQDATPITLGQEFSGYAAQIANGAERLDPVRERLSFVALGGTAVGTGVNTRADFATAVLAEINVRTGLHLKEAVNHFQAQSTLDEVVQCSGTLRTLAVSLNKIANDIRWLGSGPRAGFGELALPAVQPGSSIMPGKVNPVIAESLVQVVAQVVGNDAAVSFAAQSGNFELNVMQPVAAFNLLQSLQLLASSCRNFSRQCIAGLQATERGPHSVEQGLALCTALVPAIGYDESAAIAKEAAATGETIRLVAQRRLGWDAARLDAVLDPAKMLAPDPAPRLLLGITGGIACGKSAVGDELERLGVIVFDTDHLSHELMSGPNPTYDAVLARFGADVASSPGGPIDRKQLGGIVFADAQALRDLEAIMHPAIDALLTQRINNVPPGKIPAALVPQLFEAGWQGRFDEIWCVWATRAVQRARLKKRNGLTDAQADALIDKQWDQERKKKLSHRRINNSGSPASTYAQVRRQLTAAKKAARLA